MVNREVVLKFENPDEPSYTLVIDPPCGLYELKKGESLVLKIAFSEMIEKTINELVNFRVSGKNLINVDVDIDCKISMVYNGEETVIWGML